MPLPSTQQSSVKQPMLGSYSMTIKKLKKKKVKKNVKKSKKKEARLKMAETARRVDVIINHSGPNAFKIRQPP